MTTVLADARKGVMVSDSCVTDGDRIWSGPKVFRVRGHLLGFAGTLAPRERFLKWFKDGARKDQEETFRGGDALVITPKGKLIYYHEDDLAVEIASGREAIGSGGKAAIAAYDALGWENARRAVLIACRHDSSSRTPVRIMTMKEIT